MKSLYFTTKDNYKVHFQVYENILPTTTVFLHGNVASNRWWNPSQEIFAKSAQGKNYEGSMICIELLGCGQSEAPKKAEDVDMLKFASDFNELISSYTKEKVNLVGHSTGGFIAAAMTGLNPALFNKSLLLDPVGAKGLVLDDKIKGGFEMMKTDKSITALVIGATIYNNNPEDDFFKQVIVEDTFSAVKNISYWVVQAFHNLDSSEVMQKSTVPTLVLHGEHDNLLSRDSSEELAVKYLKNAKFEVIPGHGHCMNIENPAAFVSKISSFLF
ncbi:MAG: alpha/beta hydrolase [Pseudobdellovibrio sp.]